MILLSYIIQFILFIIVFLLVFYPIGYYFIVRSKVNIFDNEVITLSLLISIVGFVIFTLLLGVLKLRFLSIPIIVLSDLFVFKRYGFGIYKKFKYIFDDRLLLFLIIIAILLQGFINFPSGGFYDSGLLFWSSQGNDGLWHVALMEEAKKSMPMLNPIYAGVELKNYHYLVDVLMGEFGRIAPFFSSLDLYFRYFPVVFSFLISISSYSFVKRLKNKNAGYWAIFFTSLAGSFGYIVTMIKQGKLFAGETVFWAAQGNTIIGNPPHALAYAIISGVLLSMVLYAKTKNKFFLWTLLLLATTLSGYKISAGITVVSILCTAGLFDLIFNRKKELFLVSILVLVANTLTVLLMSKGVQSFLVFEPWWFIRTTVVAEERLGWLDMELRRQHYISVGTWKAWLRVIQLESTALLLFVIGNLGTRIIGVKEIFARIIDFRRTVRDVTVMGMFAGLLTGFTITLLFVQRGIAYNLIQFFQYFILIFGFFAAISANDIFSKFKNSTYKIILITLFVLISVPTVIGNIVEFYGPERTPLARISIEELAALKYLKKNSKAEDIILTIPFDDQARFKYKEQPWPISGWYATAYVPAISSRRSYITNESQADILGLSYKERVDNAKRFLGFEDVKWNEGFLEDNSIDYVYIYKGDLKKPIVGKSLIKVYENYEVLIYKVV